MAHQIFLLTDFVGGCEFITEDGKHHAIDGVWDLVIAHPPCTYLTVSGNAWFSMDKYCTKAKARYMDRVDGIRFFMDFVVCNAKRVAIENPIGIMSNVYRKPDQIIQPYEYGEHARKATCLWLRNLPPLIPTEIVEPKLLRYTGKDGKQITFSEDYCGKFDWSNPEERSRVRSKTYKGIARAMAEQWGSLE